MGITKAFEFECDNCEDLAYFYSKGDAKEGGWLLRDGELLCNECAQYLDTGEED